MSNRLSMMSSSDGGAVLLKAVDGGLGLTDRLAACLDDPRAPGKVLHETIDLIRQRVFGLCCGYADCNDAARLAHDPNHKLVLGRDPVDGIGLASQPIPSYRAAFTAALPLAGGLASARAGGRRHPVPVAVGQRRGWTRDECRSRVRGPVPTRRPNGTDLDARVRTAATTGS
jgi:Transposase DDE domain group 1